MIVIDIITIVLSVVLIVASLLRLKKQFNCRLFYYWFFWIIFVLPIVLDYVLGFPVYAYYGTRMIGFIQSYNDTRTRILYDLFVIFMQIILLYHKPKVRFIIGKRRSTYSNTEVFEYDFKNFVLSKRMERILLVIAILGPIACILTRNPMIIIRFGWREAGQYKDLLNSGYFSLIEEWSYIGVLSSLILLTFKRNNNSFYAKIIRVLSLVLLYFNLTIESKRSIIMFLIIILAYIVLLRNAGNQNLFKAVLPLTIFGVVALAVSMYVKIVSRGYVGFDALYTTTRVDFFRDDTVKLVLYSLFNENNISVLSYPFESYIMQIGYLFFMSLASAVGLINIPRRGYDFYITAAVMGGESYVDKWMTSSMYDEAIANFGIFGILIVAIFVSYYLRYIDDLPKFESILWLSFLILYTMYSLDYIILFAEGMVIIHILLKTKFVNSQ